MYAVIVMTTAPGGMQRDQVRRLFNRQIISIDLALWEESQNWGFGITLKVLDSVS